MRLSHRVWTPFIRCTWVICVRLETVHMPGKSFCLEKARGWKQPWPGKCPFQNGFLRTWNKTLAGLNSRLEKQSGWKKALAGNNAWLEQDLSAEGACLVLKHQYYTSARESLCTICIRHELWPCSSRFMRKLRRS